MLERVPAAAESTVHFFVRSVENPVRSSRVLDPRFWRNGAEQHETSAWWPCYLRRVEKISQVRQTTHDEVLAISSLPHQRVTLPNVLRPNHESRLGVQNQQKGVILRPYSVSASRLQSPAPVPIEEPDENRDDGRVVERDVRSAGNRTTKRERRAHKSRVDGHAVASQESPTIVSSHSKELRQSRWPSRKPLASSPELKVFDLTIDAEPGRIEEEMNERKVPHRQRRSPTREGRIGHVTNTQEKKSTSVHKPSDQHAYQSFDLDPTGEVSERSRNVSFDLDLREQQQHVDLPGSLATAPRPEQVSTVEGNRSQDIEGLGPDSETDSPTGWHSSNPLAALVPGEVEFDGHASPSPIPTPHHSTSKAEQPPQPLKLTSKARKQKTPINTDFQSSILEPEKLVRSPQPESQQTLEPPLIANERGLDDVETLLQPFPSPLETLTTDNGRLAKSLERALDPSKRNQQTSHEIESLAPEIASRDPRRVRFDVLLKTSKQATTTDLLDEAWALFLSFDDQEALSPYIFRLLSQSQDEKQHSRVLAAFNIIPRARRKRAMYKIAINLQLKRHQHGSAMNLAFEAEIMGFDVLPDLFAHLVRNLLWNSAAEVLHRNTYARQDFAQLAPVSRPSIAESHEMLTLNNLTSRCSDIVDLHAKVLSLRDRVQSADLTSTEHTDHLRMLLRQLAVRVVQNQGYMADITPQALISIFDVEDIIGNLDLHVQALFTIFDSSRPDDKPDLALMVYRNYRFRRPEETPNRKIIKGLIRLHTSRPSIEIFDYLMEQYAGKPSTFAYSLIINSFARAGNPEAVDKYLQEQIHHFGPSPNAAGLNATIYVHAAVGDTQTARERFHELTTKHNVEPDIGSWNALMLAHMRSDNNGSAFEIAEEMRRKRVKFNQYSYGQLLAVCRLHGDIEAALDILVDARDDGIEITVPMINTVVDTYLRNEKPQAAMKFAMTATDSKDKGSLSRLWNSFIHYFALRGDLAAIMKVRNLMARHDIPPDGMTYAPIMTLLTSMQRTSEAMEMLRRMHLEERLPVKRLHYSIILYGFIAEGNRDMAAVTLNEMSQRFPQATASTRAAMVHLRAQRSKTESNDSNSLKLLAELLEEFSLADGPRSKEDKTERSMYLETLVGALVRSGFKDSATKIMKHIHANLADSGSKSNQLLKSKGLVLAQLDVAMERQDWAGFERIFYQAFRDAGEKYKLIPSARRRKNQQTKENAKVPQHARYELSSYFNRYMEAMARQFKQRRMINFFRRNLSKTGFAFTGRNWNKYIQVLCRSRQSEHQLKAFRIFERTMLRHTQSWKLLARGKLKKRTVTYSWQPYGLRNRPILQKHTSTRLADRSDELRFHPERRIPTYLTGVYLGAALMQAHFRARRGLILQFDLIRRLAPKTKKFIQYMPRLKDDVQGSILRQLDPPREASPRPRSERSYRNKTDVHGILDDPSPLNQIPDAFLDAIEDVMGEGNLLRSLLKDLQVGRDQHEQVRADVELGEMLTGQISRTPIILAGKGRLENQDEMNRRVDIEETQKLRIVEKLREDLRARQLTDDIHRAPLRVGVPRDISELQAPDDTFEPMHKTISSDSESITNSLPSKTMGKTPVLQQLDDLAGERNQRQQTQQQRRREIPRLAIPYMQTRRLKRRIGLGQRTRARKRLETLRDNFSPRAHQALGVAASRIAAVEQARRRRQALLAYERDLKEGQRLDPFPRTERALAERELKYERTRVRFVSDLDRNRRNYAVRTGKLEDNRQKRVQTIPSKGMNYITRRDRTTQWRARKLGVSSSNNDSLRNRGGSGEDGNAKVEEVEDKRYRPFTG